VVATAAANAAASVRGSELETFASKREPQVAWVHGIVVEFKLRRKLVATTTHYFELHLRTYIVVESTCSKQRRQQNKEEK